jgi:hypothetical protein
MDQYADEVKKLVRDLNLRFVRARRPELGREEAGALLRRVADEHETVEGLCPGDLLRVPSTKFFRRRGLHAYEMNDVDGNPVKSIDDYQEHLMRSLPGSYPAGRDFAGYMDLMKKIASGEMEAQDAVPLMPNLSRVGGVCPCSRAVRWVLDEEPAPH